MSSIETLSALTEDGTTVDLEVTHSYVTVLVPFVSSPNQTKWHPTTSKGPFAVLSRGAFKTEEEAISWARSNLNGAPYSLKWFHPENKAGFEHEAVKSRLKQSVNAP